MTPMAYTYASAYPSYLVRRPWLLDHCVLFWAFRTVSKKAQGQGWKQLPQHHRTGLVM